MGFFKSSKSHLDLLEHECGEVSRLATEVSDLASRSLRGKYEYMQPDERADLYRHAAELVRKLHAAIGAARSRQAVMEQDECPSEDLLAAQSLLVGANLDVERADKGVAEARNSLISGMAEIEEFYGARSKEARYIRKLLADLGPAT
jgi:hypothetical protein